MCVCQVCLYFRHWRPCRINDVTLRDCQNCPMNRSRIGMHKTGCSGKTRFVLHAPSSTWTGQRFNCLSSYYYDHYCYYYYCYCYWCENYWYACRHPIWCCHGSWNHRACGWAPAVSQNPGILDKVRWSIVHFHNQQDASGVCTSNTGGWAIDRSRTQGDTWLE